MAQYNIAVVGVGAVGEELLRVLSEHNFPAREIRVLARSARQITVDGRSYQVEPTTPESFDGVDIALFAGTEGEKGAATVFGIDAAKRGVVIIDNGSDFRMRPDVPLVVPEVNGHVLERHEGIIANPNCSTAQLVLALKPLHDAVGIKHVIVSTYQAVSGAGASGATELNRQNAQIASGGSITEAPSTFSLQIAGNVIPQIGGFDENGYTSEEMKLVHETRKIMGDPSIKVTPVVAARVPVITGHSESVYVELKNPLTPAQARDLWRSAPGIGLLDDLNADNPADRYPTPLVAAGKDTTFVGRVRQDLDNSYGLNFWVVSDNLRKGAATNAVQIAEHLVEHGWVKGNRTVAA